MSRRPLVMLILVSLGALGAWPLDVLAYQGTEILQAYIGPGVAGFVIVTVLGFISSIGYRARSHIARAKRRLFGPPPPPPPPGGGGGGGPPPPRDHYGSWCRGRVHRGWR